MPQLRKKLLYLDQSFLSDAFHADGQGAVGGLFQRICKLREQQKLAVIVSSVHTVETANMPEERKGKRDAFWKFLNNLADGDIAESHSMEIFQLGRLLADPSLPPHFPLSDIGLEQVHDFQFGLRIAMNNNWQLRLAAADVQRQAQLNDVYRSILESQADQLSEKPSFGECLSLVRRRLRSELAQGISNFLSEKQYSIALVEALGAAERGEPLRLPARPQGGTEFVPIVREVLRTSGSMEFAKRWLELLADDRNCLGPAMEIGTAIEAESLRRWKCGAVPTSGKKFHTSYGLSRQRDVQHIKFLPYMDAITTDDSMRSICTDTEVRRVLEAYSCKLFSSSNWAEFENWIEGVEKSVLEIVGE